jgi:methylmalonyl-CoA mutase C-terminal domain/subunit
MDTGKKIRVLLTKSAMDAHDRGVRTIAKALRDAGMEVIFTRFELPEDIVKPAQEEDVGIIGISSSNSAHTYFATALMDLLRQRDMDHIPVILGGIIPQEDIPLLKEIGIREVFGPGTPTGQIVDFIRSHCTS